MHAILRNLQLFVSSHPLPLFCTPLPTLSFPHSTSCTDSSGSPSFILAGKHGSNKYPFYLYLPYTLLNAREEVVYSWAYLEKWLQDVDKLLATVNCRQLFWRQQYLWWVSFKEFQVFKTWERFLYFQIFVMHHIYNYILGRDQSCYQSAGRWNPGNQNEH